ncbi:MAG TPA: M20 family metallopeptidase [Pyrinomonadaceae bacterium]|nr:M20 family metallopeptidase [Pyrinomonadaceae bacterium]
MNATDILTYFQSRRDEIVDSIREIVDIESPSCDVERNKAVVLWVENEARKVDLDLEIEKIAAEKYGEHLIIRAFPGGGKSTLVLGHTDTVHPVGTKFSNPTRIEDGKLFGCGVFDMKANIVFLLEALRYFAETGTHGANPITILLSCDEEVGSETGREIVEREARNAERCLVLEPSAAGSVKTGRKGTGMFIIRAHGIPAHAGLEPEKGASAIHELAKHVDTIDALNSPEIGTTVNVTTMKGGTTSNVIPEFAECAVDVRFSSIAESERIEKEIRGLRSFDARVSLEVIGGINRPPMERTDAVVALYEEARDLAANFGYELGETQVGGASDGNFVAALGVPVLDGLGLTGDGAHTLHEHIYINDIAKRATLLTLILLSD